MMMMMSLILGLDLYWLVGPTEESGVCGAGCYCCPYQILLPIPLEGLRVNLFTVSKVPLPDSLMVLGARAKVMII